MDSIRPPSDKETTIYVQLLDEGTPTARPTQAIDLGNGFYKLLPTPNYDPEDEKWEFLPGSTVRIRIVENQIDGKKFPMAVAPVDLPGK